MAARGPHRQLLAFSPDVGFGMGNTNEVEQAYQSQVFMAALAGAVHSDPDGLTDRDLETLHEVGQGIAEERLGRPLDAQENSHLRNTVLTRMVNEMSIVSPRIIEAALR